jgi:hypothetical protein
MPTRDLNNQPMQFSVLAGREVSTWSEEWRHECEVAYRASMPLAQRNEALDGVKDGLRGVRQIRGEAAVAHLRAEIDRYAALKARG